MVTETIEQQEINNSYMNINNWIKYGIFDDAVTLCRERWNYTPNHNYSHSWEVRNKTDFDNINPVIKW